MKLKLYFTTGFFLFLFGLTGCQRGVQQTHISVETNTGDSVSITTSDELNGNIKETDSGFVVNISNDEVTGRILTGMEADVLNGENYDSDYYNSISVQGQNGFSFVTNSDPVVYTHVFRISDSNLYVELSSDASDTLLYSVESGLLVEVEKEEFGLLLENE